MLMKRFLLFLILVGSYTSLFSQHSIQLNGRKIGSFDNDSLLSANDSTRIPTQQAVYKFVKGNGGQSLPVGKSLFYVSKKYAGPGKALISGMTLSSISSSEPTYNTQLSQAEMGSISNTYPDPFSARNAALDKIAVGAISSATVVILDNQQWYVGADDPSKNGSYDGTATSGGVPDIQFTQAGGAGAVSSLAQNKVNYYFGVNTGLSYINVTYPIYTIFAVDGNDTPFESDILGNGVFKQYFGEGQSMTDGASTTNKFSLIDNANARIRFEASAVWLQQWRGFFNYSYKSISIKIHRAILADMNFMTFFANARNGDDRSPSEFRADISEVQLSNNLYPFATSSDWWYFICIGADPDVNGLTGLSSARTKNIVINFGNVFMSITGQSSLLAVSNTPDVTVYSRNLNMTVNIKNLYSVQQTGDGSMISVWDARGIFQNNNITYNIENYVGNDNLIGHFLFSTLNPDSCYNNNFNLNVGTAVRRTVPESAAQSWRPLIDLSSHWSQSTLAFVPVSINIKMGTVKDYTGIPIGYAHSGRPMNNYTISGSFSSFSGQPALALSPHFSDFDNLFFQNCTLISQPNISAIQSTATTTLKMSNVVSTSSLPATITANGQAPVVIPALSTFGN